MVSAQGHGVALPALVHTADKAARVTHVGDRQPAIGLQQGQHAGAAGEAAVDAGGGVADDCAAGRDLLLERLGKHPILAGRRQEVSGVRAARQSCWLGEMFVRAIAVEELAVDCIMLTVCGSKHHAQSSYPSG